MSLSNLNVSFEKVELSVSGSVRSSSARYSSGSTVGGFLYLVGNPGTHISEGSRVSLVWVLNVRQRAWRCIEYAHSNYISPHIFLYEDSLLMHTARSEKISRFDLVLEQWSDLETAVEGRGLKKRTYCAADCLEKPGVFVVFGGKSIEKFENDVELLIVPERRWVKPKSKGKRPEARYLHGSCTYEGKVFYYGGWAVGKRSNDGLHVLTLTNRNMVTWSTVASVRGDLSSFAFIPLGRRLLFCGGSTETHADAQLLAYDTVSREFGAVAKDGAEVRHFGFGLLAFRTPDADTIGILGGNGRLDHYVRVLVSQ